jgi:hypothetical protein
MMTMMVIVARLDFYHWNGCHHFWSLQMISTVDLVLIPEDSCSKHHHGTC